MRKRNQCIIKYIIVNDQMGNITHRYELDASGKLMKTSPSLEIPSFQKPSNQQSNQFPLPQIQQPSAQKYLKPLQNDSVKQQTTDIEILRCFPITPKMRNKPLSTLESLFSFKTTIPMKHGDIFESQITNRQQCPCS